MTKALEGKNIRLRMISEDDYPTIWKANQDPDTEQLSGGIYPMNFEELKKFYNDSLENDGDLIFMIERKSDDMMLGEIGIHEIHQRNQTCELGINLFCEEFRGKGYGTDALEIIMQYAFGYLSLRKITVQIYAINDASIRLFEKCGFTYSGRFRAERLYRGEYIDTLIYEKFRDTEYTNALGDIT